MSEAPLWSMSIICKNEEDSIPNLLDSMKAFIDLGGEVVVVDTGSTDRTMDVLRERGFVDATSQPDAEGQDRAQLRYYEEGDKFVFYVNEEMIDNVHEKFLVEGDEPFVTAGKKIFNFGAARRYAGGLCSNEWILSIDCDEVFSAMNIQFLNHIIRTGDVDQISFVFRYRNTDTGGINSITSRDKLYNRSVCEWKWVVHEQAVSLPGKTSRMTTITEGTLGVDHYQHAAEHRSNYLVQMCIDVMENPENDRHTHWLGREMHFAGLYNSAIKLLKWYIRNPEFKSAWGAEKCMSCIYIGDAYKELSNRATGGDEGSSREELEQRSLSWYFSATFYEKAFREPWIRIAQFYQYRNDHLRAVQFAQAAITIEETPTNYMNDSSCYGAKPYDILYWGLYWLGKKRGAYEAWKQAKALAPDNPRYANDERLFTEIIAEDATGEVGGSDSN